MFGESKIYNYVKKGQFFIGLHNIFLLTYITLIENKALKQYYKYLHLARKMC